MAAPVNADFTWHPGTNGVPTDDVSATIGAIDTGEELTPDEDGQLIAAGEADVIGGSSVVHYGGGYIALDEGAGGSLQSAYLMLANGALALPSAQSLVFNDPTGANDGLEIVVTGMVGGEPVTEELELDGSSGSSVSTSAVFDNGSDWWAQTKSNASIAGADGTDDIAVSAGGTQLALMRAPKAGLYANGCRFVGSIYRICVATAADEAVSGTDRLTLPTATSGLSSFSSGALVAGSDQRQSLGSIEDGEFRGFVIRRTIPAGMPLPSAKATHILVLTGLASA